MILSDIDLFVGRADIVTCEVSMCCSAGAEETDRHACYDYEDFEIHQK